MRSSTSIGEVSLRRRRDPGTGVGIFEVKLGDGFLMSGLFTAAEIEVARLGAMADGSGFDPKTPDRIFDAVALFADGWPPR